MKEYLDKQKLLKYIGNVIDLYGGDVVLQTVKGSIEKGYYDDPTAQEEIAKLQEANKQLEAQVASYERILVSYAEDGETLARRVLDHNRSKEE